MRPLFGNWDQISARLRANSVIALFLDFDGTLTPIRPRPEMVRVHPAVRRALLALSGDSRFHICVISARRRDDIRERLRVPGIRYLGLYGWERGASAAESPPSISCVRNFMKAALPLLPGAWLEDKLHTVAIHYRGCPDAVRRLAADCLRRAVEPWSGILRIAPGKCVWEVLPRDLGDKGAAVRRELALLRRGALPVYLGDDFSDEAGFASAARGLTVRVGTRRPTRARYAVDDPGDVLTFLERLQAL